MKRRWILLTVSASLLWSSLSATIINIPGDYPTIQEGIDASTDGDTVLVQPGSYVENINFNGHNILVGSLFLTTGDTTYIGQTIIDGDSSDSVVSFESGEDSTTVIVGFTIQNGYAEDGGGIYCVSNSNPTVDSNIIGENSADIGGGIHCSNSNPRIINNVITANSANFGGGICCRDDSNPVIADNIITANFAYDYGGGISVDHSNPIIVRNMINENWCDWHGGGIFCNISNPIITNSVISENACGGYGGGIFCLQRSSPTITNSVLFGNFAVEYGSGITCAVNSSPVVTNSVFWADIPHEIWLFDDSFPVFTYCDIQDWWDGEGNIYADPLFIDPENGDFHLMSTACGDTADSPCIDTGSPAILDSLLDCSWGLGELRSDMGAYGGGDSTTVGIDDYINSMPDKFLLMQNYPNPFNATTVIRYTLPEAVDVRIEIYNILGQRVEILFAGFQQAGEHAVVWDASDYPSGVYFARLEIAAQSSHIKMVLLK